MAKLDNTNRLLIPKNLLDLTTTDFSKEVRAYLRGREIFLDNPSEKLRRCCCLGVIKIDPKRRFFVSPHIRSSLNITKDTNIVFFVCNNQITFRKICFIPENR